MIPGSANSLLLASAAAAGNYQIERSLRFNSADSANLSRTPGTAGNRRTWTWAGWVKRSGLGAYQRFFATAEIGVVQEYLRFENNDTLRLFETAGNLTTTQVFRDTSAWFHLVVSVDTTQATSSDRIKLYVNGTQVTSFSTATYPSQNFDTQFNRTIPHYLASGQVEYFSGYLADIHFIDGQALTPSSFTEVSATTGQLIPKAYIGSYGTNGFYLQFADNSAATAATLGKDTSGNSNNWTPNNLSTSTGGPTSVAAASGALPVFNTTDTYGTVKGTGTRTDTNSASIVLALPMDGTNGGTSFGDQSAVIKGSGSAKTVTVNGNSNTSTAQSKFYGSSGLFDGTGDFLGITPTTDFALPGDFTIEAWMYSALSNNNAIFSIGSYTSGLYFRIGESGDQTKITIYINNSQVALSASGAIKASQWTHVTVVRAGSTVTIYVNGVSVISGTSSYSIPSDTTYVGRAVHSTGEDMNGYLQDVRVYKGVAKYTSNFNPPSATANATVAAGNDSLVDTPTSISATDTGVGGEVRGNYCTLNPLDKNTNAALVNGNLTLNGSSAGWYGAKAGFGMSSGKWYFEVTCTSGDTMIGIGDSSSGVAAPAFPGYKPKSYGYYHNGNKFNNDVSSAYGASYGAGDVIGIAFNADNGTLTYYKNGTSQGVAFSSIPSDTYFPYVATYNTIHCNFGQRAFAYTAPSGFKALCDTSIPEGTITTSGTFTGNASADGPFVYLNGVPTAMTINSNAVTFATHADKLSNGFKLRTSSGSYNTAGSNSYSITTTGAKFKYARAQPNP